MTSECTRGTGNSVAQHNMSNPGALNVQTSVNTRENDSCREHCISREPPGYYFGRRVLLPECSCRWPWSDVLSTRTSPRGCALTKGCWIFFLRTRLCTARNYYWSEQNKTEKPSDEPPTDQEHRPRDRADQAHRARLIARSIISFGCILLVKSVFIFVYCFFEWLYSKTVVYSCDSFLRQRSATCTAVDCVQNITCSRDVCL